MSDFLIKNGTIIDGSGDKRFTADIRITEGKISEVGPRLGGPERAIDATNLCVMPGIIDPHTHLDGQLLIERDGSPSSWNGVTTVLMGHCGYSLAPLKREHRDYIVHMFARVEEISPDLLEHHVPWGWTSFSEYLDQLDRGLGLNVAAQVGHSALRYFCMGSEAAKRAANEEEIEQMCAALRTAMNAGAFGFTTSLSPTQVAWDGAPVPSRCASREELIALAGVLGEYRTGAVGLIPKGIFTGLTDEDRQTISSIAKASGKAIQLNGTTTDETWSYVEELARDRATVYALRGVQPFYRYFTLAEGTNAFNSMDTWRELMMNTPADKRLAAFDEPSVRQLLRGEVDWEAGTEPGSLRRPRLLWSEIRVASTADSDLKGVSLLDLAARRGQHVVDAMLDIAGSERYQTQFIYRLMPENEWFTPARSAELSHPSCVPLFSDAGAHLGSECKAGEGIYFLSEWVRNKGAMTLEEGVRKVTSLPASLIGITDRGRIKVGAAADIVVFDLDKLECLPKERVQDLPGGFPRWIQRSNGIEHVFVNGEMTISTGLPTRNLPGRVLRATDYA